MSAAIAADQRKFVRRTTLNPDEYRKNFRQIDSDVIVALTSGEASRVTPQMSKVYLSLINTPSQYWEREGVLRFTGCERGEKWQTAWEQLVELMGVASATARKALAWMSEQGIIGYFAGKNGVGIRIFINRAASSIGRKLDQGQKNLRLVRTSPDESRTSMDEVSFKESFAVLENLDLDLTPRAPENGAADTTASGELSDSNSVSPEPCALGRQPTSSDSIENYSANAANSAAVEQIVREVVPQVKAAAAREQERTREWFITHALPKAIRVAQASAYDVLRAHGHLNQPRSRTRSSSNDRCHPDGRQVGKQTSTGITRRLLSDEEITELAEGCVALLVTQGQSLDRSLSEMSVEAGGFLLAEDATKIRAKAEALTHAGTVNQNSGRESNGL